MLKTSHPDQFKINVINLQEIGDHVSPQIPFLSYLQFAMPFFLGGGIVEWFPLFIPHFSSFSFLCAQRH